MSDEKKSGWVLPPGVSVKVIHGIGGAGGGGSADEAKNPGPVGGSGGGGVQALTEVEQLRAALRPFAEAARLHGVRRVIDGDLWVSLGVASSAWLRAAELVKS